MGKKRRSKPKKQQQSTQSFYRSGKLSNNYAPERENNPDFNNPYQFVPVHTQQTSTLKWNMPEDIQGQKNLFARHDYWNKDGLSGRIVCQLKTMSPVMVGGYHTPGREPDKNNATDHGDPAIVHPYLLPDNALNRASDNQNPMIPANSLRGMVASIAETISQSSLRVLDTDKKLSVRQGMEEYFTELGILFRVNDGSGYDGDYIYPVHTESFGNYRKPEHDDTKLIEAGSCFHFEHNFNDPNVDGKHLYIRGHCDGFPTEADGKTLKKRHEHIVVAYGKNRRASRLLFKPEGRQLTEECIRIKAGLVDEFQYILQQRYREEPSFQHLPKGYEKHPERMKVVKKDEEPIPHVLEGDLVFYRALGGTVTEMAYSRIWRRPVQGTIGTAFALDGNLNALPWSTSNQRTAITPAESLFGVVEDNPKNTKPTAAKNLASRVHFSDAKSKEIQYYCPDTKTLKILNSPKPPSPSMYFSAQQANGLSKKALNLTKHSPNGRKQYIPHSESLRQAPIYHWESNPLERRHMHMSCRPLDQGVKFAFNIHFENLSCNELDFLLKSLAPSGNYIHRLGLGKPLGLGHVKLSISQVKLKKRRQRYTPEALFNKHELSFDEEGIKTYLATLAKDAKVPSLVVDKAFKHLCILNEVDFSTVDEQLTPPVCYPFALSAKQSAYNESEGFAWFSENDDTDDKYKQNIRHLWDNGEIPPLKS